MLGFKDTQILGFKDPQILRLKDPQNEYVSTQGNETMSLHVCIKCVLFEEYKVVLVAIKLFLVYLFGSLYTITS